MSLIAARSYDWKKAGYRIATILQCQNTEALQAGERLCLAKGVYQNTSTDVQNTTIASWYINTWWREWYSAWLFNFSAPLMILSNFVFGPLPWSRKLCLRMQNLRKEFAFLESFWKWHANNVLLKNVNHLPRLHFLFEENVDVDITEISAHQDKLLP